MATDTISNTDQFSLDEELRLARSRQRGLGVTGYQFVQARHMPRNPSHLEYLIEFLNRYLKD